MGTLERLQTFRASWAELTNQALERHGHEARIDHRSYRARGIERDPEKHLGPVDARRLSLEDREALRAHRQAQQDVSHAQQRVSQLDITASLQAAIQERDARAELTEMLQVGRAEARQEYAAWKAEQERLALERERTQARREFKDWQHEHAREHALPEPKRQRELDKTQDLERDNDLGLSL